MGKVVSSEKLVSCTCPGIKLNRSHHICRQNITKKHVSNNWLNVSLRASCNNDD